MRKSLILILALALSILGIINTLPHTSLTVKQSIYLVLSLVIFVVVSRTNIITLIESSHIAYLIVVALLVGVLFAGSGAKRWFAIGPINFQPSEVAKALLPLYLLKLGGDIEKILAGVVVAFLIFIEPDLATSTVILVLTETVIFITTRNLKLAFYLVSIPVSAITSFSKVLFGIFLGFFTAVMALLKVGITWLLLFLFTLVFVGISTPIIWNNGLKEYQRKRIVALINPSEHPEKVWQVYQSRITLANSKPFGKGIYGSTQKLYGYLPASHTDFAFSSFVETYGYIPGFAVLIMLWWLVALTSLYGFSEDRNLRNISLISTVFFTYQTFANLMSVMGVFPVAGIPFPFLSYGGSHLLSEWLFLGLLFSAERWKIS